MIHSSITNLMALSDKTMNRLADALAPEVVEYILEDDRWTEFMVELISDAIVAKLGTLDGDLHGELAYSISERLLLKHVDTSETGT
jgi:hypothetical protein